MQGGAEHVFWPEALELQHRAGLDSTKTKICIGVSVINLPKIA